jgi:hypothetical protein
MSDSINSSTIIERIITVVSRRRPRSVSLESVGLVCDFGKLKRASAASLCRDVEF